MQKETILFVDKPKGITSFDVIRFLRKKLGIRKMGHAGTLDPLATGLLIIGVNEGTKRLTEFLKLPKVYTAEILLGIETDAGDITGTIVRKISAAHCTEEDVKQALTELVGNIDLPVPAYSAVKRHGKPLYAYARGGQNIELPVKNMHVERVQFESFKNNVIKAIFSVGSGTYIRSLAVKIGEILHTVATLQNLRRLSIGEYSVERAIRLDDEITVAKEAK